MPNFFYTKFLNETLSDEYTITPSKNIKHSALYFERERIALVDQRLPIIQNITENYSCCRDHFTVEKYGLFDFHYTEEHYNHDGIGIKLHAFYSIIIEGGQPKLSCRKVTLQNMEHNVATSSIDNACLELDAVENNARFYTKHFDQLVQARQRKLNDISKRYTSIKNMLDPVFIFSEQDALGGLNAQEIITYLKKFTKIMQEKCENGLHISQDDRFYEAWLADYESSKKITPAQVFAINESLMTGTTLSSHEETKPKSQAPKKSPKKKEKPKKTRTKIENTEETEAFFNHIIPKINDFRREKQRHLERYVANIEQGIIDDSMLKELQNLSATDIGQYFQIFFDQIMAADAELSAKLVIVGHSFYNNLDAYPEYIKDIGTKVRPIAKGTYASPLYELFLKNKIDVFAMFLEHGMEPKKSWLTCSQGEKTKRFRRFRVLEAIIVTGVFYNEYRNAALACIKALCKYPMDIVPEPNNQINQHLLNMSCYTTVMSAEILNQCQRKSIIQGLFHSDRKSNILELCISQAINTKHFFDNTERFDNEQVCFIKDIVFCLIREQDLMTMLWGMSHMLQLGVHHSIAPSDDIDHVCDMKFWYVQNDAINCLLKIMTNRIDELFNSLSFQRHEQLKIIDKFHCSGKNMHNENPYIVAQYLISRLSDPTLKTYNKMLELYLDRFLINKGVKRVEWGYFASAVRVFEPLAPDLKVKLRSGVDEHGDMLLLYTQKDKQSVSYYSYIEASLERQRQLQALVANSAVTSSSRLPKSREPDTDNDMKFQV